jgi:nucleoside-diphosphate-sugar epimerase
VDADLRDEVIHLASGEETTINDLGRLILDLTDAAETPILYEERRRGEVERTFARPEKGVELLGFEPAHTLAEGLRKTVDWFAEQSRKPSPVN